MTEYQLLMDHPNVEKWRHAADILQKKLWNDHGMSKVLCVRVSMSSDLTGPTIRVYMTHKKDQDLVPKTFNQFEVLTSITDGTTT